MLKFRADDFTAKLPWFYHGMHLRTQRDHDVLSFEVNGLKLPAGRYDVALVLADPLADLHVSFEGLMFEPISPKGGIATLRAVDLSRRMLSFFFMGEGDQPLAEVLILPQGADPFEALATAPVFDEYVRDIKADEREVLTRWDEFYSLVGSERFGADDLMGMFSALLDWCERRQALDEADPHYGAVYSEEDKYDFRDAAAAAVTFTYAWRDSGEESWLERARIARKYVHLGQHTEGERRGGWAHMVSGKWGGDLQQDFRRITTSAASHRSSPAWTAWTPRLSSTCCAGPSSWDWRRTTRTSSASKLARGGRCAAN